MFLQNLQQVVNASQSLHGLTKFKVKNKITAWFINMIVKYMYFLLIGQGVFTKKDFIEGEVLLEYSGELIEGAVDVDDTYVFQIRYKGKQYW